MDQSEPNSDPRKDSAEKDLALATAADQAYWSVAMTNEGTELGGEMAGTIEAPSTPGLKAFHKMHLEELSDGADAASDNASASQKDPTSPSSSSNAQDNDDNTSGNSVILQWSDVEIAFLMSNDESKHLTPNPSFKSLIHYVQLIAEVKDFADMRAEWPEDRLLTLENIGEYMRELSFGTSVDIDSPVISQGTLSRAQNLAEGVHASETTIAWTDWAYTSSGTEESDGSEQTGSGTAAIPSQNGDGPGATMAEGIEFRASVGGKWRKLNLTPGFRS